MVLLSIFLLMTIPNINRSKLLYNNITVLANFLSSSAFPKSQGYGISVINKNIIQINKKPDFSVNIIFTLEGEYVKIQLVINREGKRREDEVRYNFLDLLREIEDIKKFHRVPEWSTIIRWFLPNIEIAINRPELFWKN